MNIKIACIYLLLLAFFVSSCTRQPDQVNTKKQTIYDELKIGTAWDSTKPGDYQPFGMWEPACLLYETLVNLDQQCNPIPCLASNWDISDDGLIYTFYLQKNVLFHDNTVFDAKAVKINFETIGKTNWHGLSKCIKNLYIVDDFTIRFILHRPVPLFFIHLAGSGYGIIAPSVIVKKEIPSSNQPSKMNKSMASMPGSKMSGKSGMEQKNSMKAMLKKESYIVKDAIGTGPYKWSHECYQRNKSFCLIKNDKYWQKDPVFKKITWFVIPDSGSRAIALETGEIHMTGQSPNAAITEENLIALKKLDNIKITRASNWGARLMIVNHTRPPFDNINVRKALKYALNYNAIQKLFDYTASICPGPFGPDTPFTNKNIKLYDYNPQKAKDILDQQGLYDLDGDGIREYNGKNIEIKLTTGKSSAMDVLVCEYLTNIGIKTTINSKEKGALFAVLKHMDFDIAVHHNIPGFYLDLYGTFSSKGRWFINFNFPDIQDLLDQYIQEIDYDKFQNLNYIIQDKIHEKDIILFGLNESKIAAYDKSIGSFVYPPEEWVGAVQEIWQIQ